jgi:hypothetical protein
MCLAIVKPKGIIIPEEHLYNGWLNNNDGAGFACITTEGDFFVHKSLTYEGFIDVYRNAVKDYGNTSDFLIHFRIASKGNKTIDNCHPFIIDEDRIIIHNGTLYNINIDKKDTRSDTKVFAEDWLSQLPNNWEDNKIIHFMLEDFITSGSKICMLHRTKGIYIFNEDIGVRVDGIWYSNKSYEEYVPFKSYYPATSFYSFIEQRLVTFEESKKMTPKEIEEHRKYRRPAKKEDIVLDKRWVPCYCCGDYDTIANLIDMQGDHVNQMWCWDCYKGLVACDCCGKKLSEKDVDEYYNNDTKELVTLCDECAPYMNLIEVVKDENADGQYEAYMNNKS